MRITGRTPPVRIAARDMLALSELPAEIAGWALRWGMRRYAAGAGPRVEEARAEAGVDERGWRLMLDVMRRHLDADALEEGEVVVSAFRVASEELARVSASKIRARNAVEALGARAAASVEGPAAAAAVAPALASGPSSSDDPWDAIADALLARGIAPRDVGRAVSDWRQIHAHVDVMTAVAAMDGRRVSTPLRYLDTVLRNDAAQRRQSMPEPVARALVGARLPKPVRRRVRVGPRAAWTMEGWTARGDQNGGDDVEDRLTVWRNDAGTLSYKPPESGATIPTYEEDPGVYAID